MFSDIFKNKHFLNFNIYICQYIFICICIYMYVYVYVFIIRIVIFYNYYMVNVLNHFFTVLLILYLSFVYLPFMYSTLNYNIIKYFLVFDIILKNV